MNGYIRCRLASTEEVPTINPFDEDARARLPDVERVPPAASVGLLHGLHSRWAGMLRALDPLVLRREFHDRELGRNVQIEETIGLYGWHGRHQLAHIMAARS